MELATPVLENRCPDGGGGEIRDEVVSLARLGETDRGEEIVDDARLVVVGGTGQAGRGWRMLCVRAMASSTWLKIGAGSSGLGTNTRPTFSGVGSIS